MTKADYLFSIPLVFWLAGCGGRRRKRRPPRSLRPSRCSVVTAGTEQWPAIYEATGTVRARTSAMIAAKWMGYVREVKVQVGDRVREGQLLVTLDARDLDASAKPREAAREEVRKRDAGGRQRGGGREGQSRPGADHVQAHEGAVSRRSRSRTRSSTKPRPSSRRRRRRTRWRGPSATQLDSKLAQADQEVRVRASDAQLRRSARALRRRGDGEVGGARESGRARRAAADHRARRRYRLEASVDESQLGCDSRRASRCR